MSIVRDVTRAWKAFQVDRYDTVHSCTVWTHRLPSLLSLWTSTLQIMPYKLWSLCISCCIARCELNNISVGVFEPRNAAASSFVSHHSSVPSSVT